METGVTGLLPPPLHECLIKVLICVEIFSEYRIFFGESVSSLPRVLNFACKNDQMKWVGEW